MDHHDALRLSAAEGYMLGELPAELQEQFEEHYFDCPACTADLKALTQFMGASQVLFQNGAAFSTVKEQQERKGWLSWLSPAFAVPAIATLAAVVIFQAVGIIPALRDHPAPQPSRSQLYASSFHLPGLTRSAASSKVAVRPGETFSLDFDFTPARSFPSYRCSLIGPSGKTLLTLDIPGDQVNKELHLLVQGGVDQAGNYALAFAGQGGTTGAESGLSEVQRIPFIVEFRP